MPKLARVPIHRTSPTQTIMVEPGATRGAQIGTNLLMPDGTLATAAKLQKLIGATPSGSSDLGTTDDLEEGAWNLYFTKRRAQDAVGAILADSANVTLRYTVDGDTPSITADLTDLADTGAGALLAITRDAKGRVTGTRDATITGTDGHIAVANGDASAGRPRVDLDASIVALLDFLAAIAPDARATSDGSYRVTDSGAYRVTA